MTHASRTPDKEEESDVDGNKDDDEDADNEQESFVLKLLWKLHISASSTVSHFI